MKNKFAVFSFIIALALIFSACSTPEPHPQKSRQEQLSKANLFGIHNIAGVNIEGGYEGNFEGGFFLFGGNVQGKITNATNYIIDWYKTGNERSIATIPRYLINLVISPELSNPQIEFVFQKNWLLSFPFKYEDGHDNVYQDEYYNNSYTQGSLYNPNNFIKPENLDIVNIFISPEDLEKP